jgi:Glyoxalase/Bleomycin resistance protein/Dioxygenase superfamily
MNTRTAVLPGPIRQYAYIVDDFDQSMSGWLSLGIGPWIVLPSFTQSDSEYRGIPTEPVVSFALANSGELQIELIHQEDESPSIYKEFTDAGGIGFHHVAFWSEDFDDALASGEAAGWPVVHRGTSGGVARFAYLDAGGISSTVVEVMELNDITGPLMTMVRDAARDWDGADPIRTLG